MSQAAALPSVQPLAQYLQRGAFICLCLLPLLLAVTRAGADIATVIIAVFFILASLANNNWQWTRQPEVQALAALWVFMMATAYFSPYDSHKSFVVGSIWIRFALLYVAMRYWLLTTPRALTLLTAASIAALLIVGVDAAWQYLTGMSLSGNPITEGSRLTAMLNHANVGNFMLKIGLPVAAIVTYRIVASGMHRPLLGLAAVAKLAIIALIMVSGERSIALLMLLGMGVIGLTIFLYRPQARRLVIGGGIIAVVLIAALAATQPVIQQRGAFLIQQLSNFENTYYGQLFKAGFGLWWQNPISGIGAKQFLEACQFNMPILQIFYCDVHPHNLYVEWLAATGLIGFALFVCAVVMIIRNTLRELTFTGHAAILAAFTCGGMAVVLWPLIVTQSVFTNWPAILFWFSLAFITSLPRMTGTNA